jgi:hypothetical protein
MKHDRRQIPPNSELLAATVYRSTRQRADRNSRPSSTLLEGGPAPAVRDGLAACAGQPMEVFIPANRPELSIRLPHATVAMPSLGGAEDGGDAPRCLLVVVAIKGGVSYGSTRLRTATEPSIAALAADGAVLFLTRSPCVRQYGAVIDQRSRALYGTLQVGVNSERILVVLQNYRPGLWSERGRSHAR